jgi:hypothetical protein
MVLREAKRLHRAATSDALSTALPVLRRLLAAGALPCATLPELYRRRQAVQRKHILRTLAVEAGFGNWESYRPSLAGNDAALLAQLAVQESGGSHLNLWFSDEAQAQAYAAVHGGRAVRVGQQAVVLPLADLAPASPTNPASSATSANPASPPTPPFARSF